MKRLICCLFICALFVFPCSSAFAEESAPPLQEPSSVTYDSIGLTLEFPENFAQLKGSLFMDPYNSAVSNNPACYAMDIIYIGMPMEEYSSFEKKYMAEEATDEEIMYAFTHLIPLGICISTAGTEEDVRALFDSEIEILFLGTGDDFQFYYVEYFQPENTEALDPEYAEEAVMLSEAVPEVLQNASFAKPNDPMLSMVGKKVSFTAKDLDGIEHTSEELFSANQFTMVNIWGTWCPPCVSEMEYLAQLHKTVSEMGCGLVGIEFEYSFDETTLQGGRDLLAEKGTTYPNVLVNETMDSFMVYVNSFPTSLFVDREGTIVLPPFTGVPSDGNYQYLPAFENLLAGVDNSSEEE